MEYKELGTTGIEVSRLCFGTLTMGPLQRHLSQQEGSELLIKAVDDGVNFFDTADLYDTYNYINIALKKYPDLIIATKSYAYNIETARTTLSRALEEIGRDYIDIFLLHEMEGMPTIKGHREALEFFTEQKQKGIIRAVGISTHYIEGVQAACSIPEIDVIHTISNYKGTGIVDGTKQEMEKALSLAKQMGKGIYSMKPLGGGHLYNTVPEAFDYVLDNDNIDSIAVGMWREEEINANIKYFNSGEFDNSILDKLKNDKKLLIHNWCTGCSECIDKCSQKALYVGDDNKTRVDTNKCILCGYCGKYCNELAIKII